MGIGPEWSSHWHDQCFVLVAACVLRHAERESRPCCQLARGLPTDHRMARDAATKLVGMQLPAGACSKARKVESLLSSRQWPRLG